MAAVLSETVTDTSHYSNMRRDNSQASPSNNSYSQPSRSRIPPSPRAQPTSTVPAQTSANTLISPSSSQHTDQRQSFASQQGFSTPASSQAGYTPSSSSVPNHPFAPPLASPASSNSPIARAAWSSDDIASYGGQTIKVRDLNHIQSFATEEFLARRNSTSRRRADELPLKYEISGMPIADVIEMVAGLLTKITTTNDLQHKAMHDSISTPDNTTNMSDTTSSVLAFHGKNVPGITILSYLSRIHKYCPTTYEVFLSLLVYFDRMTERVNAGQMRDLRRSSMERKYSSHEDDLEMKSSTSNSTDQPPSYATPPDDDQVPYNLSHFFVVDSFNIHRLVIAGVTCASKFFSDVFYTNSRYAKVRLGIRLVLLIFF